jgi:dipeptidyl aminopeptidase/acylaminoacyl peptidase
VSGADERVRTALRNWGPRFLARGVDHGDVERLAASIASWDDWLPRWCEVAQEWEVLARDWEAAGRRLSAGEAWQRAALAFHFARFLSVDDEAAYLAVSKRAVAAHATALRLVDPAAERVEARLGPALLAGILRRPPGVARAPLVLLVPGLDSTKEEFLGWSDVLLRRGLATLAIDGPGQGEGGYGDGRMRPDYEAAVAAFLDVLPGAPGLDLDRVGLAGVSVGGYYAPRAAAFEPRVRAVVAIGGPYDVSQCWPGFPPMTRAKARYHLGCAGEAEAAERLRAFTLRGVAARVRCPMLLVAGRQDRLVPYGQAARLAAEAPQAELLLYETGNHCCTNLFGRHTPLTADWLAERLGAAR